MGCIISTSTIKKLVTIEDFKFKTFNFKVDNVNCINKARAQSIYLIHISNMEKCFDEYIFEFSGLLKQSRPGYKTPAVHMKSHPPDRYCTYVVVKEYLSRNCINKKWRRITFINYVKPHKAVTRDTVSQWIKMVLNVSGINTDIFGSHSVRSAPVSKAKLAAVPVDEISRKVGWSNAGTMSKFKKKKKEKKSLWLKTNTHQLCCQLHKKI